MSFLREQPTLAVFLVIGLGYLVGRLRVAGLQLGTSTGVLIAGLVLGHFGARGTAGSESVGFMLFIYCVGLRAGPEFFRAFRENGARFAALAVVAAASGAGATVVAGEVLDLPAGYRSGLLAGALSSTPTLVAAQDAVRDGIAAVPPGVAPDVVLENIAAAYAITYAFGLFGLLVAISLLPRIMGVDLEQEARRLARRFEGSASESPRPIRPAPAPQWLDRMARWLPDAAQRGDRSEDQADLLTFAFGMAAGIAVGALSVRVAGIPITLGTAGGLLFSGLVIGLVRAAYPGFGTLSAGATAVLMELGLQFFMANIGLEAGGSILEALRSTGPWLPVAALVVVTTAVSVSFAVGLALFRFDAVTLLGALTGAMTSTPALDMVNRRARSTLPSIGYAGTYAFANVLMAVAGSLLMRL